MPSSTEISPAGLEKKIFKFCQCIFAISSLSPLEKGQGPSFKKKINPLRTRMLCAKFGRNWPSGCEEKD